MKHGEFVVGLEFSCGGKRWRCTDIGARVIVAICLEPHEIVTSIPGGQQVRSIADDPKWFNGPPYAVIESVFDEYAIEDCSASTDTHRSSPE